MILELTSPEGDLIESVPSGDDSAVRLHLLLQNQSASDAYIGTLGGLALATLTSQSLGERHINRFCRVRVTNDGALRIPAGGELHLYPKFEGLDLATGVHRARLELNLGSAPQRTAWTTLPDRVSFTLTSTGCEMN